mmetsp:Transcript_42157/g.72628  ORF Transcript_42157/g.72628 Transcript_42157/m.72628 type:complete len:277 (+) Transcript_42157:158-988(+)
MTKRGNPFSQYAYKPRRKTGKKMKRSLTQTESKQVAKIAKKVTLRTSETKRHVVQFNSNQVTEGFAAHDLTTIAQGDEIGKRDGRQIIATSLKKNFIIRNNSFLEPVIVRTLILQGKTGITEDVLSSTDIFNASFHPDDSKLSWDDHSAGSAKLLAILKPIDTTKWIVKEDKTMVLGPAPNPNLQTASESHAHHDGRSCVRFFKKSLNMKQKVIHYNNAAATVTETVDGEEVQRNSCENRLHFVTMCCQVDGSQVAVVGGSTVNRVGTITLYYKDP